MSLENVFYIMAIFYMVLGIILLFALVVGVFYIKKKVDDLQKSIEKKMDMVQKIVHNPAETAIDIGASLAESAIEKFKNVMEKKKTSKKN